MGNYQVIFVIYFFLYVSKLITFTKMNTQDATNTKYFEVKMFPVDFNNQIITLDECPTPTF